ncbi:MAG: GMC family oxidoreductase N-terminal domain-containing protein [Prevotellaceae bacterium]|nr:GMC family oxidoreductase N-terminal domain-containing protein [Prevotellaceae bacterium]
MKKIAIIGSGAYGSYAASLIGELHPDWKIHIFESGDETIKDQDTMGLCSEILGSPYEALTKGRYFGLGGTTAKWGGQILTFSKNDFCYPTRYMNEIVELNEKYRQNIFKKVGIENNYPEEILEDGMFTKTGVWLDYFLRNLFKKFHVKNYKNVVLHTLCRVIKINVEGSRVVSFNYIEDGTEKEATGYDQYFLSAGAFETTRLMMVSGLQDKTKVSFGDHIVKKVFKIKGSTKLGKTDFGFKIKKFSFITTRIIGEKNNLSYFIYPVFNLEFPFFQNLKKFLFGKKSISILWEIMKDIPSVMAFVWSFFFLRKLYVYKKEWYLCVHVENKTTNGNVYLSQLKDRFDQQGLAIDFHIDESTEKRFSDISDFIEKYLQNCGVDYERLHEKVHTEKFEDEYHPFGIYSDFASVDDYYNQFENMLVIHSGVLPRAGGINSTAAAFPLLEEYIRNRMG